MYISLKLSVSLFDNNFIVEVQENGTLLKLVFLGIVLRINTGFSPCSLVLEFEERGKRRGGGLVYLNVAMECDL